MGTPSGRRQVMSDGSKQVNESSEAILLAKESELWYSRAESDRLETELGNAQLSQELETVRGVD